MIEFSQPAQCLFCPQRRKIALLMKLVLAASAAIITGIVLFQPGSKEAVTPRDTPPPHSIAPSNNPGLHGSSEGRPPARSRLSETVSKRSAEILAQNHEGFQKVQAQVQSLLREEMPLVAKAQKFLDERRREVLKAKVLTLGEGLFSESGAAEAERKLVLEALDKELDVLAEQKKLLSELKGSD